MGEDTRKQLAWEARHKPRAALAALLATAGLVATIVLQQQLAGESPKPSGLETLLRVAEPGDVARLPSLQIPVFEYLRDNLGLQLLTAFAGLIGYIAMGWAVGFLGVAARARRDVSKRLSVYLPLIGGVLLGLYVAVSEIGRIVLVDDILAGPRTVGSVANTDSGLLEFAQILRVVGALALGAGLVAVGLNAIRTGLMTRLFGYLGVVTGGLMLLPIAFELMARLSGSVAASDPMPVVGILWLAGTALLLLGRWPGGVPPAWRTGLAEPWPAPGRPARSPAPAAAAPQSTTSPRRRKRKKKRH